MKTPVLDLPNGDMDYEGSNGESNSLYLDSRDRDNQREGGNVNHKKHELSDGEQGLIDYELHRIKNCGKHKIPVIGKEGQYKIITIRCHKPYCPRCGGRNGFLHKERLDSIASKLGNLDNQFIRQFVFTIPQHLTIKFMSAQMLKKLLETIKKIIEREFGVVRHEKKTKKGLKRKYSLNKKVLASLELFGEKSTKYHPHVNVIIVEEDIAKKKKDFSGQATGQD